MVLLEELGGPLIQFTLRKVKIILKHSWDRKWTRPFDVINIDAHSRSSIWTLHSKLFRSPLYCHYNMLIYNHCACNTDWLACAWAEFKAACINDVTKIWTFFTSSILSLTYALRLMSCCHEMSYSPSPSLCDVIYEWPLMSKHLGFGPLWGYLNHVLPSGLRSKLDFEGIKFSARIVGRDSTLLLQGC